MKQMVKTLFLGLLLLFGTSAAQAVTLAELFNGGSIVAGDKLFDNWTLIDYNSGDAERVFNAMNITVEAMNDGGLNPGPGLAFSASNNELTVTGDGTFAYVDLWFGFSVSVLDSLLRISDTSLELTQGVLSYIAEDAMNDLGFYIRETVGTAPWMEDLGVKEVEFSILDNELFKMLDDLADFLPQREIWVTKNILVWASNETDTAEMIGFNQRFSQTQTVIPEPSTIVLTLLGLAGLVVARKRRP